MTIATLAFNHALPQFFGEGWTIEDWDRRELSLLSYEPAISSSCLTSCES